MADEAAAMMAQMQQMAQMNGGGNMDEAAAMMQQMQSMSGGAVASSTTHRSRQSNMSLSYMMDLQQKKQSLTPDVMTEIEDYRAEKVYIYTQFLQCM